MNKYLQMLDEIQQKSTQTGKISFKNDISIPTKTTLPKQPEGENKAFDSYGSAYSEGIQFINSTNSGLSEETLSTVYLWLKEIGETNKQSISNTVEACENNPDTLQYVLEQMANHAINKDLIDDRRHCNQCLNLSDTGRCKAAANGSLTAIPPYFPDNKLPRRCEGYRPNSIDLDTRPGCERWPSLAKKIGNKLC